MIQFFHHKTSEGQHGTVTEHIQWEFLIKEAVRTPEIELKVWAVFAENTALHEENAALKDEVSELKERLAWFEKQVYGQKSEKTEVVLEGFHVR